jgi:hypothetical protein
VEEEVGELCENLEARLEERLVIKQIKEKVHDPQHWQLAHDLASIKLSEEQERELLNEAAEKLNEDPLGRAKMEKLR